MALKKTGVNKGTGTVNGYKIGPEADLQGADLRGSDLRGANLEGAYLYLADLSGADLEDANLTRAVLQEANLSGAILRSVTFVEANLYLADLSGADLTEAQMREAVLQEANFEGANLSGAGAYKAKAAKANFENAVLSRFYFNEADLRQANFKGATVFATMFRDADLRKAVFEGATLENTRFPAAKLAGADFSGAILKGAKLEYLDLRKVNNFRDAVLQGASFSGSKLPTKDFAGMDLTECIFSACDLKDTDFSGANLTDAAFSYADLRGANLSHAKITEETRFGASPRRGADFSHTNLRRQDFYNQDLTDANFEGADLTEANFGRSQLKGAKFRGAILVKADLRHTKNANLRGAILVPPSHPARAYGAMTGPILKIGKPDSPVKAAEFKRKYPAEFERLKGDTSGRDFTDSIRESLREKYRTPFDWVVTADRYTDENQRWSEEPNEVMLLNVNIKDKRYTPQQRKLLEKLSEVSRRSGHPHEKAPFFTIGWVRYTKDDNHGVLLIEEVQSDVEVVRTKMKGDTEDNDQLRSAGIEPRQYAKVLELLRPYSERFYEDAIGLIYQKAEAIGYTVEMLGYEDKKEFDSPRSVYTDLPRRLGMSQKRQSEVPTLEPLLDRVSYYKPNPSKPPRWRRG